MVEGRERVAKVGQRMEDHVDGNILGADIVVIHLTGRD